MFFNVYKECEPFTQNLMKQYQFETHWTVEAPIEVVWTIIKDAEHWPQWWKALKSVEIVEKGDSSGMGERTRSVWRTALPYTLQFDFEVSEVAYLQFIGGNASGELEGFGRWTFTQENKQTHIRYDWHVRANKKWMQWLAPLLRPLFRWNHDVVMAWGESGLRKACAHRQTRVNSGN